MDKAFDAVKWTRERRAKIDQEDEGLTWEQRSVKTFKLVKADPAWKELTASLGEPGKELLRNIESDRT